VPVDTAFVPAHGTAVRLSPLVTRVTAGNAGPLTFAGTNSYLVGGRDVAVIDPGPDDPAHRAALLAAVAGRPVVAVLVTHTHRDHSAGAAAFAALTGAPLLAEGPHRPARPDRPAGAAMPSRSGDTAFRPDRRLADGDGIAGDGWSLVAVATPGHCANHLAFALAEEAALFSGDHVMAWSTTVVAPPDGAMTDYLASLARLAGRAEAGLDRVYWPGHGGPVVQPARYVTALAGHRRARAAALLAGLADGPATLAELVARHYPGLAATLTAAAAASTLAQLEAFLDDGRVDADGPAAPDTRYRLVRE
jgi:glyoxylase-like metal-dependent hydrolase (beta-lactamase superfamily II)